MSGHSFDKSEFVAATANRLRMVQVDFADESEESRADYLSEQIERSLAEAPPDRREAFLAALMEQFPSWNTTASAPSADVATDPDELVTQLILAAKETDESGRARLSRRLSEAGLSSSPATASTAAGDEPLRRALKLTDDVPLDPAVALALAGMLSNFASQLDQLAWNAWRAIHPRSAFRRAQPLRELMGGLFASDATVAPEQVRDALTSLGVLVAAMTSGIKQAGLVAERRLGQFSPGEIERAVDAEGRGLLTSKEIKLWRKYLQLWNAGSGGRLENEIREAIAQHVETLMNSR